MKIYEEVDIYLEFLSSYSLDYNPIEKAFAELKAWIRKNYMLAETYDGFDRFLEAGMRYMSRKPGKHFRSCHIDINT